MDGRPLLFPPLRSDILDFSPDMAGWVLLALSKLLALLFAAGYGLNSSRPFHGAFEVGCGSVVVGPCILLRLGALMAEMI